MDISIPIPILSGLALLILCLSLSTLYLSRGKAAPLPPGSTGWPVVGESLSFLAAGRAGNPERFIFDRLAKSGPAQVFKTSLFGNKVAVLCGTAGNKHIFSNENKLVASWWPSSVQRLFPSFGGSSFNDEARTVRSFLPDFLVKPECLRRHVPILDDCARAHVASGAWGPAERLVAFVAAKEFSFRVACRLLLNIDAREDPDTVAALFRPFHKLVDGLMSIPIDLPGTTFHAAMRASEQTRGMIGEIVRRRKDDMAAGKVSTSQDILSHLIHTPKGTTVDGQPLYYTDMELATHVLGLLFGGHESTSVVITLVLKYLAELPHVYEAVYQEQMKIAKSKAPGELLTWEDLQQMKYSWNVACEVMRLVPPAQGGFKQVLTDFVYDGVLIPKGWKVFWSSYSTHWNPECFPMPEKFDPTRFEGSGPPPYSWVPFGGGPRICPGKDFARLEILVFMHNIVTRFKWEKLLHDEKIITRSMPSPAKGLPLRLIPLKAPN